MFFILGLMIGSIYSIIMGPTTLTTPQPPITFATFNWLAFAIGVALIFVLQFFGNRRNRKKCRAGDADSGVAGCI